jgi:hypothetical protein
MPADDADFLMQNRLCLIVPGQTIAPERLMYFC